MGTGFLGNCEQQGHETQKHLLWTQHYPDTCRRLTQQPVDDVLTPAPHKHSTSKLQMVILSFTLHLIYYTRFKRGILQLSWLVGSLLYMIAPANPHNPEDNAFLHFLQSMEKMKEVLIDH